jgi:hypothetical protein
MAGKLDSKIPCQTLTAIRRSHASSQGSVISAIVVEPANLSLHTSIVNLLWYSVECISLLPSASGKNRRCSEHFIRCASSLKTVYAQGAHTLDSRAQKLLYQFVEEAEKTANMLRHYLESTDSTLPDCDVIPQSAGSGISAKATYLQWLAVCMSEEIRLPGQEGINQ